MVGDLGVRPQVLNVVKFSGRSGWQVELLFGRVEVQVDSIVCVLEHLVAARHFIGGAVDINVVSILEDVIVDLIKVRAQREMGVEHEKEHAQFRPLDDALSLLDFLQALIAGVEGVMVWSSVQEIEHPKKLWQKLADCCSHVLSIAVRKRRSDVNL